MTAQPPAPGLRPDNSYSRYWQAPFNRPDYYPLDRRPDPGLYRPIGGWMGRLILPPLEQREQVRGALIEIHIGGGAGSSLVTPAYNFGLLVPGYAILVSLIAVLIQALGGGLALIGYGLWQRTRGGRGWPALVAGALVTLVGIGVWLLPPAAPDAVMARVGGYALVQGVLLGGSGLLVRLTGRTGSAPTAATQAG